MAAPKGEELLNILFDEVIKEIGINGKSLLKAINGKMAANTFYDLIKDDKKLERYARATDDRADLIADETLAIADNVGNDMVTLPDGREVVDNAVVQRDRLRVDTRKWLLSKLHPKKYGEKIEMDHNVKVQSLPEVIIRTNGSD